MCTVVETDDALVVHVPSIPVVKNKLLQTNHPCAICGLYGHYSHHCPNFPKYRSLLSDRRKHSCESEITILEEIHPLTSSSNTNNIVYMISTSNSPSSSSTTEDPPDISQHHFHGEEEILENTTSFTPFHLVHSVESILPIECHIPSLCLTVELLLDT